MSTLSILVHADSKVGKSTLSTTCPPPICVFDVEGGWKFVKQAGYMSGVPLRRREWDPSREPPPRYDGTWDFCHVHVTRWELLTQGYMWLTHSGEHDFRSIVVDSVTEGQRRLRSFIKPDSRLKGYEDWGDLLILMDTLIRNIRDLTLLPAPNPVKTAVFIAETVMKDGKWRPAMQGQIGNSLPYLVDICGYMFTEMKIDEKTSAPLGFQRKLLIGQGVIPNIISGERVQGLLPLIVDDPHITQMYEAVFGPLEPVKPEEAATK
jgi:hypothetical protein